MWCLPGDREHLNLLLKHIYYKYDEKGNLIDASTTFTKKFIESEELPLYRKKYLNTGMKTPNGFYFQQGDWENFLCDPTNSSFKKFREEIYWKDSKCLSGLCSIICENAWKEGSSFCGLSPL